MQNRTLFGSLAGAARLLNDNVLRHSQDRQKRLDYKGKRMLDRDLQY